MATLTNRNTGKTVSVRTTVSNGLITISARQYNRALSKLGHGPIRASENILVKSGTRDYAFLSA